MKDFNHSSSRISLSVDSFHRILVTKQLNAQNFVFCQPVHGTATYRCDDTRCCTIQFWPTDDEHI